MQGCTADIKETIVEIKFYVNWLFGVRSVSNSQQGLVVEGVDDALPHSKFRDADVIAHLVRSRKQVQFGVGRRILEHLGDLLTLGSYRKVAENHNLRVGVGLRHGIGERQCGRQIGLHNGGLN